MAGAKNRARTYWRGARVVESTGLENRNTLRGIEGSNPSLSAKIVKSESTKENAVSPLTIHYRLFTIHHRSIVP